jgi:hypothetical protein
MFTARDRCQMRAALTLWNKVAATSRTHPSETLACKGIFMTEEIKPLSEGRINALILALEEEVVYTTVSPAARKYKVNPTKLRRDLERTQAVPVPGTLIYNLSDILYCVNRIRKRESR